MTAARNARDLVLLHGALGAGSQFDALAAALGGAFRVHRPDFEGHGSSPWPDRPFRIEHFADNAASYLEREGLSGADVFGYSMGGYVALYLAATRPPAVGRIATLGTKFAWTPEVAERERGMLDPRAIAAKVPRFAERLAALHVGSGWERVLHATAEMMQAMGERPPLTDATLATIDRPVRIGVGDRDATVSIEESRDASRVLPKGELEVHPRTPHPLEKVNATRVARSLAEFFD